MVAARPFGLNRKQRKELARRLRVEDPGLAVMHPNAAGIDVGNSAHYVAVRPDRDPDSVRRFECFTADLHRLADWLQHCGVTTVAMQSTGVYWIPLYDILDGRGIDVYLVNARHTRNLPGRKSDVQESQWLLKLHTYGLLRNSFHPPAEIRVVRTYWRQRGDHVHAVSTCIQRMQKVLTQMNIQLANVISDLSGWTGQRIVRAILAGERDPATLAALSHPGIHATRDTIAKSLEGTWQPDLLFVLEQEVAMYDAYQQRIAECDQALEQHLKGFADKLADPAADNDQSPTAPRERRRSGPKRRRKAGSHAPQFDLGRELHCISGVDLTRIDGIDVGVAQTVISEVGLDMTRWKTEHFASWLGLCPDNRITGGKVIRKGTRHVVNRAATAFRLAATP
jgi:transposase